MMTSTEGLAGVGWISVSVIRHLPRSDGGLRLRL